MRTVSTMDPPSDTLVSSAAMLIAQGSAPPPVEEPAPEAEPPAVEEGQAEPGGPATLSLEGTGVRKGQLAGSMRHFRRSGLDPRDYLYKAMPHAGRLLVEFRAGFGMGDVDRQALLRVETRSGAQSNSWYREGPASSSNLQGSLYLGYAPITTLDVGVVLGFHYANRAYDTGSYDVRDDDTLLLRDIQAAELLPALDLTIQPRVRGYVVPVGPAKPYLVGGAEFKVFDDYDLTQSGDLTYPEPGWRLGHRRRRGRRHHGRSRTDAGLLCRGNSYNAPRWPFPRDLREHQRKLDLG